MTVGVRNTDQSIVNQSHFSIFTSRFRITSYGNVENVQFFIFFYCILEANVLFTPLHLFNNLVTLQIQIQNINDNILSTFLILNLSAIRQKESIKKIQYNVEYQKGSEIKNPSM